MSNAPRFVGDYYEVLGVPKEASADDIKKAFRKLARECHPDVAGSDPDAASRFNQVRNAYETLADDEKRAEYDRKMRMRHRAPTQRSGRMAGGFRPGTTHSGTHAQQAGWRARANPANQMDLEDLFNDFVGSDFGFGGSQGSGGPRAPAAETPPRASRVNARSTTRAPGAEPGRDITLSVDVPTVTATRGGTVSLTYPRLRRAEDGSTLFRYEEIFDLRVSPGTRHGDSIRIPRMGDAGIGGGPFGDLICDVVVVGGAAAAHPEAPRHAPPPSSPPPAAAPSGSQEEVQITPIGVAEAILGGRIEVRTPSGRLRITVPPGSSSGVRLRLRGKGSGGGDLLVELRIVVPRRLDEESRRLIERFAELNPLGPEEEAP